MTTVVTRAVKGSPLTYAEMDANFNNLNSAKLEAGTAGTNIANTPAGTISSVTVQAAINELDGDVSALTTTKAPLVSPTFTGTPAAPTPTAGDNDTSIATTAFVTSAITPFTGKNLLINGAMRIDQRHSGVSQTITAGAALSYTVDRWYGYCTGANCTGQQVAGTAPNETNYQFTGAASVTKIGFAQRIEAANSQHLAGTTATLSVDLANSLLTTVTWTAWRANTEDTFGTLASPTRTQIGTGTFTVTSTLTRYSTQISVPAASITGIEVEFSVAAQTSGTWIIGRAQLESGSIATSFDVRFYGYTRFLCNRYYVPLGTIYVPTSATTTVLPFPCAMRAVPTISGGGAGFVAVVSAGATLGYCSQTTFGAQTLVAVAEIP